MMADDVAANVTMVPVELIDVVNPRVRNKKVFKEIVASIADVGLKKPITVTRRSGTEGVRYDLVCGQGRLEAFQLLGQNDIPALVVEADADSALIMSLVENLARRQVRSLDLLHDIQGMKKRGHTDVDIARKTGLTVEYVRGVNRLLSRGEVRLLRAVEAGIVPVSIAVEIAETDDAGVQRLLQQAYESKALRGKKLLAVKRIIERRRQIGKGKRTTERTRGTSMSINGLLRTYKEDTDKKRLLVRKAEATRDRLIFVQEALRALFEDESFVDLLHAEGLDTLPRNLADRLSEPVTV
jgi:ParB family chromosome partitioning protein